MGNFSPLGFLLPFEEGGNLVYNGIPYGLYFDTVDGETADWNADQSYWSILIGEEYATVGADGIVLTDGGEYSLVYTIG